MNAHFYEPKYRDGKIVAFADVDVSNGVIVKGFRLIQGDRGLFGAVPSRAFQAEGRTRYYAQVTFSSGEVRDRFMAELLEAYQLWEKTRRDAKSSHAPADELVEGSDARVDLPEAPLAQ
jgi:DNA-binding cell septation regulator SpoVG